MAVSKLTRKILLGAGVFVIGALGYIVGLYHGTTRVVTIWRDVSFAARDGDMRRLLSADELLAGGKVDPARRKLSAVAYTDYIALEEDAASKLLPATDGMVLSIEDIRRYVERYCASNAAGFHVGSETTVCKADAARRSNNRLQRAGEE
jgi:hypothetical protein